MIAGKNYRTVSEKCWSAPRRLADLPTMGLAKQVLSPMPELLSYWFEPAHAQQTLRYLHEQIESSPTTQARSLFFDTLVARIEAAGFDASTRDRLTHQNAVTFLGLQLEAFV